MQRNPINADTALAQMLAGKSTFTIYTATGRFTYRIEGANPKGPRYNPNIRFIKVLTGNDNDNSRHYTYFAWLEMIPNPVQPGKTTFTYRFAHKAIGRQAPSVQMFEFVLASLRQGTMPAGHTIWHEGRCCKCGRTLTVPQSILDGIGPECAKFVGTLRF